MTSWSPSGIAPNLEIGAVRDLELTSSDQTTGSGRSSLGHSSGKRYAELKALAIGADPDEWVFGLAQSSFDLTDRLGVAGSYGLAASGDLYLDGAADFYASFNANSGLMVAVDLDAHLLWLGAGNEWANGGDPATGTAPLASGLASGAWYLTASLFRLGDKIQMNAAADEFQYSAPSGFTAWGDDIAERVASITASTAAVTGVTTGTARVGSITSGDSVAASITVGLDPE